MDGRNFPMVLYCHNSWYVVVIVYKWGIFKICPISRLAHPHSSLLKLHVVVDNYPETLHALEVTNLGRLLLWTHTAGGGVTIQWTYQQCNVHPK